MRVSLQEAVSAFGREASSKLSNPGASGAPEDQLRAPLEALIPGLAELAGLHPGTVVMVGETSLADIKTRPDYAVTRGGSLVGFIEIKAPGKGADPRRFRDRHDREQWGKLQTLPNLIYTDGNGFSLWRNGSLEGDVVRLEGDVETAGAKLAAPDRLVSLFVDFFRWEPEPPRSARELAGTTARLCRLLREEVTEQLGRGSPSLTNLARDWRRLLFPSATDEAFADGYAQAVTFGLLMARARDIVLADGLDRVAKELRHTNTLIGTALRLLTDDVDHETALKTSLPTLTARARRGSLANGQQRQPGCLAVFLRGLPERLRQRLAQEDGLILHPARGGSGHGAAGRRGATLGAAVRTVGRTRLFGGDRRRSGDGDRHVPARCPASDRADDGG